MVELGALNLAEGVEISPGPARATVKNCPFQTEGTVLWSLVHRPAPRWCGGLGKVEWRGSLCPNSPSWFPAGEVCCPPYLRTSR